MLYCVVCVCVIIAGSPVGSVRGGFEDVLTARCSTIPLIALKQKKNHIFIGC